MTTTTQVFVVADCSGSMAGSTEATMRKSISDAVAVLAGNEPGQWFNIQLCPFSGQVRLEMPYTATELARRPDLIAGVNTSRQGMGGGTALLDAIGRCLEEAEKQLKTEPALVMVFTDGGENASYVWNQTRLAAAVDRAEKTGNLTLTVAGPKAVGDMMQRLGLKPGNFRAWEGGEKELRAVSADTTKSLTDYATRRSTGETSLGRFYADPSALTPAGIKAMTTEVVPTEIKTVSKRMAGRSIADFFGRDFKQGRHFYELVKAEYVQDDKDLIIFIRDQNQYRLGSRTARALLGLPETGKIRLVPSAHTEKYLVFVRSGSNNRKVVEGQQFLTVEA